MAERRQPAGREPQPAIERVQTGVRIERRLLKVLKALAELKDMTLGDLIEGVMLHNFEGRCPFEKETLRRIAELKRIYGLELGAEASHRLEEKPR
jgi:hypothetical protein